jgi:phosphatidate cytidylyltransferase
LLLTRVLSAVVLVLIAGAAIYFGGPVFALAALAVAAGGAWELAGLLAMRELPVRPALAAGAAAATVLAVSAATRLAASGWGPLSWVVLPVVLVVVMGNEVIRGDTAQAVGGIGNTLLCALYPGLLAATWVVIRNGDRGLEWAAVGLLATWACDTGAYFVGSAFGRHGFFRHISPKKSLEGAVGGLVTSMAVTIAAAALGVIPGGITAGVGLGVGIAVIGQIGDLAESMLKRNVGAKDSGNLIPGHGGILDRMDAMLFVGAFLVTYVTLFGR